MQLQRCSEKGDSHRHRKQRSNQNCVYYKNSLLLCWIAFGKNRHEIQANGRTSIKYYRFDAAEEWSHYRVLLGIYFYILSISCCFNFSNKKT